MAKRVRQEIPTATAARVLFMSDRTCCVCRTRGKPVQIHHIDDDPSNNPLRNLAVLCLDCHRETQIRGGFDRKLDADQVTLYRDNWVELVARGRAVDEALHEVQDRQDSNEIALATSVAEIYRENGEYELLAAHYDALGNDELRDKYVELSIQRGVSDEDVCFLRGLQGKPDLIPQEVVARQIACLQEDGAHSQLGRLYTLLGDFSQAAKSYLRSITESLEDGRPFSVAFYLKELTHDGVIDGLFMVALDQAEQDADLWWQVRALEELGWRDELHALVRDNAEGIRESEDPRLLMLLAQAEGDKELEIASRKRLAHSSTVELASDAVDVGGGET